MLRPSAFPRSSGGNASVRIAALLEKMNACTDCLDEPKDDESMAPCISRIRCQKRRIEPAVKMANPIL